MNVQEFVNAFKDWSYDDNNQLFYHGPDGENMLRQAELYDDIDLNQIYSPSKPEGSSPVQVRRTRANFYVNVSRSNTPENQKPKGKKRRNSSIISLKIPCPPSTGKSSRSPPGGLCDEKSFCDQLSPGTHRQTCSKSQDLTPNITGRLESVHPVILKTSQAQYRTRKPSYHRPGTEYDEFQSHYDFDQLFNPAHEHDQVDFGPDTLYNTTEVVEDMVDKCSVAIYDGSFDEIDPELLDDHQKQFQAQSLALKEHTARSPNKKPKTAIQLPITTAKTPKDKKSSQTNTPTLVNHHVHTYSQNLQYTSKILLTVPHVSSDTPSQLLARSMLTPSNLLFAPVQKRGRGRPRKNLLLEQPKVKPVPSHKRFKATAMSMQGSTSNFEGFTEQLVFAAASRDPFLRTVPDQKRKVGRPKKDGPLAGGLSRKEIAYSQMEEKYTIYNNQTIEGLLCPSNLLPGRQVAIWIQRHPYGSTKIWKDISVTWCRYEDCKGVDSHETIQTPTGEIVERNRIKFPRTMIAGVYQVAIDYGYVADEAETFKDDPRGHLEYHRRNVFESNVCYFHLRCLERMTIFPNLVRQAYVMFDHRVLNEDRSENKHYRRKGKGGSNPAEIEWYLKDPAENWMATIKANDEFNPTPGSVESLENILMSHKKLWNDKKLSNSLSTNVKQGIQPIIHAQWGNMQYPVDQFSASSTPLPSPPIQQPVQKVVINEEECRRLSEMLDPDWLTGHTANY